MMQTTQTTPSAILADRDQALWVGLTSGIVALARILRRGGPVRKRSVVAAIVATVGSSLTVLGLWEALLGLPVPGFAVPVAVLAGIGTCTVFDFCLPVLVALTQTVLEYHRATRQKNSD